MFAVMRQRHAYNERAGKEERSHLYESRNSVTLHRSLGGDVTVGMGSVPAFSRVFVLVALDETALLLLLVVVIAFLLPVLT